jgi:hypothetical protein
MGKRNHRGLWGGIAIVVIGGIILFAFQQGYFELQKGPKVRVTEIYPISGLYVNFGTVFGVEVYNEGDVVGDTCIIHFNKDVTNNANEITSGAFAVIPKEKPREIRFDKINYNTEGNYVVSAYVECSNQKATTPLQRTVTIAKP